MASKASELAANKKKINDLRWETEKSLYTYASRWTAVVKRAKDAGPSRRAMMAKKLKAELVSCHPKSLSPQADRDVR